MPLVPLEGLKMLNTGSGGFKCDRQRLHGEQKKQEAETGGESVECDMTLLLL